MQFDETMPTPAYISLIYREHAKYINQKLQKEDLTFGLYPLLIEIYKHNEIIQETLAKNFHLNESTITRNLNKLEEKGFIKRIPDKRTKKITLTDKGKTTIEKVMDYDEVWDDILTKDLSNEERDTFKKLLIKIAKSFA